MLTNCSEELDVMIKNPEQQSISKKKHKILQGTKALEKRTSLIYNLKKEGDKGLNTLKRTMNGGITLRTEMQDIESLIDYSKVHEVDQGNGVISYTYMLDHPDTSEGKFFNLILKTYGTLEKVIMVTYSMDEQFISDYNLSGDITNFTGTIQFELITYDTGFPCDEDPFFPIPINGGSGSNGGGGGGSGGSYQDLGPVSANGPEDGGNPYNQTRADAMFLALSIHSLLPVEEEHSNIAIVNPRFFRVELGLEDPSNPCGEDEEIGIIEPNHEKNCEDLKKLSTNISVKEALEDLRLKADDPTSEHGYSVSKSSDFIATEIQNNPPYTGISAGMALPFPPPSDNAVCVIHTHPNDYLGYLMFSAQDFFYFYNIISKHVVAPEQPKILSDYSLMVVTHQGIYALKVENPTKFITAMGNYNQKFIDQLDKAYQNRLPEDPINHFEKDILGFMSDYNMGVSLYKAEDDLSNWSKLELNGNWNNNDGDDVKYTPCK